MSLFPFLFLKAKSMSVVNETIVCATKDQLVSESFSSQQVSTICATAPFGENEGAMIQFSHNGAEWQDLYLNGILQELIPTHTMLTILGPGLFRVIKSATTAQIGIVRWWSEMDH